MSERVSNAKLAFLHQYQIENTMNFNEMLTSTLYSLRSAEVLTQRHSYLLVEMLLRLVQYDFNWPVPRPLGSLWNLIFPSISVTII